MKKILGRSLICLISLIWLILYFALYARPTTSFALECGQTIPSNTPPGELSTYIQDCQSKLSENRGQQATLSSAIAYLNNQISLTQAKILATERELVTLELEISDLSGKISSLDYSLTDLTKLFVARIRETYIRQEKWTATIVAQGTDVTNIIRRLEYAKRIRDHDREILVALEQSRLEYDNQKTAKEAKQQEVAKLRLELDSQKTSLAGQVATKNKLLADTKNDEQKFASLMNLAQRQLASFRRFVSSQGGAGLLGNETKCDDWGCYYNQRDAAWGNQFMGLSNSLMREYGCLVTSMAMVASHYGKSIKPGDIAANSEPFFGSTAYMNQGTWTASGVTMTRTRLGSSLSLIDEELAAGRPVIVGIYGGPDHFLVIKGREGSDYLMHDPFPSGGANLRFTSKYPLSAISTVDRISVN